MGEVRKVLVLGKYSKGELVEQEWYGDFLGWFDNDKAKIRDCNGDIQYISFNFFHFISEPEKEEIEFTEADKLKIELCYKYILIDMQKYDYSKFMIKHDSFKELYLLLNQIRIKENESATKNG